MISATSLSSPGHLLYWAAWLNLIGAAVVLAALAVFGRNWPEGLAAVLRSFLHV